MMTSGPYISVIICTYNRAESLNRTLESINAMTVPDELSWELIIVDNNSKDNTRQFVEDFIKTSGLNCRYVFEEKQGLSHARNRGTQNARGEIIAFTDDDVIVDKYWLNNIVKEFKVNAPTCIGGKILPIWEKPCPEWLKGEALLGYLALLDLGNRRIKLTKPKIWGANFVVKASTFEKVNFNPAIGRIPGKLYAGEDTEFIGALIERGKDVFYCPDVIVHHCIPSERTKRSYFRRWKYDEGTLIAVQMGHYKNRNIMNIPLYEIRYVIGRFCKYLWMQLVSPHKAFHEQLRLFHKIGFVAGRIKYRKVFNKF